LSEDVPKPQIVPRPLLDASEKANTMKRIVLLLAAAIFGFSAAAASAHEFKLGSLEIEHPYARATPPNAPVSGGYMTIRNTGTEADRLISGEASFAERVEVHEMTMDGEVMKMRQLVDGLEIPAGGEVVLQPGGYHIMFIGIDSQFKEGEVRKAKLTFEKAGTIELDFNVENVGAMKMDGTGKMDHGKMGQGQMKQGG
jgi:periplasmic copper chaperone A